MARSYRDDSWKNRLAASGSNEMLPTSSTTSSGQRLSRRSSALQPSGGVGVGELSTHSLISEGSPGARSGHRRSVIAAKGSTASDSIPPGHEATTSFVQVEQWRQADKCASVSGTLLLDVVSDQHHVGHEPCTA
jgi:hypothetical protein